MLQDYSFHLVQLGFIKASMDQIPNYRPFYKTPAQVAAMVTAGETARSAYLTALTARQAGQAALEAARLAGHGAAVQAYAIMKSVYASDAELSLRVRKLPKKDTTVATTLTRMEALSKLWAVLPHPPGQAVAFVAGELTRAEFDALWDALKTASSAWVDCTQAFQKEDATLHALDAANVAFIRGALAQGRAQFGFGTPERDILESIPTEENTPLPGAAVITEAESNLPGEVHLLYSAPHATRYTVLQKGATDAEFSIAQEGENMSYDAVGVPAGPRQYKVIGQNSRGSGPESAVTVIEVAQAQAA